MMEESNGNADGTEHAVIPKPNGIQTLEQTMESPISNETASLSSLTSPGSTPSRDPTPTRVVALYKDVVPADQAFWIEINPKSTGFDRDAYEIDEEETNVVDINGELGEGDNIMYEVRFEDDHIATLPVTKLLCYTNGSKALTEYHRYTGGRKRRRSRIDQQGSYHDIATSDQSASEDELTISRQYNDTPRSKRRRTLHILSQKVNKGLMAGRTSRSSRSGRLVSVGRGYREDESDITLSDSSSRIGTRRSSRPQKKYSSLRYQRDDFSDEYESEEPSGRTSRSSVKPKVKKSKEYFPVADDDSNFAERHQYWCMFSQDFTAIEDDSRKYVMCQGCSFMYHIGCLGHKVDRLRRGHNIIVLDERDGQQTCVFQCGHCAGVGKNGKNTTRCLCCGEIGERCGQFKHPDKAVESNQMDIDDNTEDTERLEKVLRGWNDASKILFRCMDCDRACHFSHLPPPIDPDEKEDAVEEDTNEEADKMEIGGLDESLPIGSAPSIDATASTDKAERGLTRSRSKVPSTSDILESYTSEFWRCNECRQYNDKKVEIVLGWRTTKSTTFPKDVPEEFIREYLVKFEDDSYARAVWVPATWLSGVSYAIKSNFDAKGMRSIESSEDVIPEEWLHADIIFDVRYNDDDTREKMKFRSQKAELEALSNVSRALCKWQKLKYEESTWEDPPAQDSLRWQDFKAAYEEYVRGHWTHTPNYRGKNVPYANPSKSEDVVQAEFGHRLEKKEQPTWIEGGKMFDYQIEGMNWLYFQWYKQTSAILADEMGLGKTIQIIAMISTIFKEHKRWPFLVIAPNSTIENWRREFRKWAPSLRVVSWPGTSEARDLVKQYELCRPKAVLDLKAHVVITGYGTARNTVSFLRKYDWECLIVDEGQALKNDKSELFEALCTLKVHHRIILTGTPLQNNIRELFNIMQFLDPGQFNADDLQERYEELDEDRVREIHAMLRPRFLRRTKADVLKFLPPKSEIIIPLSMSSVQKELYKSIVSQNSELMKAITRRAEKGQSAKSAPKLQNILMQLRKCLAHPFVQEPGIENREVDPEQEHRALVEASGKLSFLAKVLPKLKERGHRVLIFSQFLDMLDLLEDFLQGIGFRFARLDGQTVTSDRQHMIDEFNAVDSKLDCFLLSTRAGGAGINLATADTVIVYDPDHNPHQDMQALARAHRIGQVKKVLVFSLMTRNTVEEKIYQSSKKKMVLDHLIVESIDNNEQNLDVESMLLHGLKALFEDGGGTDIKYDDNDIEKLLDRSQFEETVEEKPAEEGALGSFKTARIWANSTAQLEDLPDDNNDMLEVGYWDQIIQERMSLAEAQRLAEEEEIGRGKRRASRKVDYSTFASPKKQRKTGVASSEHGSDAEDDEFQEEPDENSDDQIDEIDPWEVDTDVRTLHEREQRRSKFGGGLQPVRAEVPPQPVWPAPATSQRPTVPPPNPLTLQPQPQDPSLPRAGPVVNGQPHSSLNPSLWAPPSGSKMKHPQPRPPLPPRPLPPPKIPHPAVPHDPIVAQVPSAPTQSVVTCQLCSQTHEAGRCPLREVDLQQCPACGYYHLHVNRTCPLLQSLEYVETINKRLKESTEEKEVVRAAKSYIYGIRADLKLRLQAARDRKKNDD